MKTVLDKLKKKNFTNEKLEAYITNPNIKKIYSPSQLEELKALWYEEEAITDSETMLEKVEEDNLEEMTKDQLDEYSINNWGIDLDKRFTKERMLEELASELAKQ